MAKTRAVKIMIPEEQLLQIQKWVDTGKFASISSFCTTSVEKEIERQKKLIIKYHEYEQKLDSSD